ncbi:hypothetical protein [Rhodococcus sp. NPDC058481]|uniref:hypothetical protein n=1 Tax=unclassified Rhodococcus (in: high G+C Gram-positive bacteria) TaxID=192944 RepID=UPI003647C450
MTKKVVALVALATAATLTAGCSSDTTPSSALPEGVSRVVNGFECYAPDLQAVTTLVVLSGEDHDNPLLTGVVVVSAASVKTPGPLPDGAKGSDYVTAVRFYEEGPEDPPMQVATFAVASPTYGDSWYAYTINDVARKYFAKAAGKGREDTQAAAIACLDR